MERTPSPPRRVHTPPAPLHGDNYEPFSPRRSSRVAAQRGLHHEQTSPRSRRDVTPTASNKRSVARASHFALSPPSSPISPQQHRSPRSTRRAHVDFHPLDSDSDHVAPTPGGRFLTTMAPGMLPTPAKTPRKRRIEDLSSTARVLFPSRPATIDEVIPTPRKARKTKNLYTLESFAQHNDESAEKIPIYTDSKERVPSPGTEEDNPFIVKKGKGRAKATPQKPRKAVNQRTEKMTAAAERDEGMVYIFRGRKVFRKFHNGPPSNASEVEDNEELSADELQLRRQIGAEAHRPLTRSSIKPRLLFQAEIQERNRENGIEEDDEEAVTDIEVPVVATPSRRKGKEVVQHQASQTTPPPTVRKAKKEISFDSWSRVKSAHSSSGSSRETKKRAGEPLEREADKRARSEHSTSSMSLDSF
ncbi:Nn.00g090300.m01.CDS01 [Neocucurbitaria sp. VM-36]